MKKLLLLFFYIVSLSTYGQTVTWTGNGGSSDWNTANNWDTGVEPVAGDDVVIGNNCIVHANSVIGADGFGFAKSEDGWVKIHQLGSVLIADNVEIGAAVTIDRGALGSTIIEQGVILDDQVHIAHNVVIGENTAIAGATAIAGSTSIGKNCTIAGAVGIVGHLKIVDNVHITAMSLVTHSIKHSGAYSSGTAMSDNFSWRKNAVRFNQLDKMHKRLKKLESS